MARAVALLVTCEHGGNRVPARFQALFRNHGQLLASHRGHDFGSLAMARDLSRHFDARLIHATTTRLLVDLNRSIGHPRLFSPITRVLPRATRDAIIAAHYRPYRDAVDDFVSRALARGRRVVHISSHSFTPALDGVVRDADIGLLYDPARRPERDLCNRWHAAIHGADASLRIRRNYPYPGKADGLTTFLRRRHPASCYIGVELEINQRHPLSGGPAWRVLRNHVVLALEHALN